MWRDCGRRWRSCDHGPTRSGRRNCGSLLRTSDFGLPEPEVNGRILDDDGRFVAFGDLVYRRWRVILEYDGEQHRTDERQFARDVERLDDLARLGWRVVRVSKQHRGLRRIQRLRRVHEALIERGWSPNATP